jgi:hypothetical protein
VVATVIGVNPIPIGGARFGMHQHGLRERQALFLQKRVPLYRTVRGPTRCWPRARQGVGMSGKFEA